MRAGLLTETIHVLEEVITTSETGAEKRGYVEKYKIRAYRKKLSAAVGDGVNANEEFITNTIVFQVRKYRFLNEDMHIKYRDKKYKITLIDPQSDNSYLITCSKINE